MNGIGLSLLWVFLPALGGGIIQGTTGFGAGIIMMLFFPIFLPMLQASALSTCSSLVMLYIAAWKYRKKVSLADVLPPFIFYFALSTLCIGLAKTADMGKLKAYFGAFLIVIALYFIFAAGRIKLKKNLMTAAVCGSISGVANGFFGVGGPPMAMYFLAASEDEKERYMAMTQVFFALTGTATCIVRIANGIITADLLPLAVPAATGLIIGREFGRRILDRINAAQLKKAVYTVVAASGLIMFLSNI